MMSRIRDSAAIERISHWRRTDDNIFFQSSRGFRKLKIWLRFLIWGCRFSRLPSFTTTVVVSIHYLSFWNLRDNWKEALSSARRQLDIRSIVVKTPNPWWYSIPASIVLLFYQSIKTEKSYCNSSNQPQNLSLVTYRGWKYKQR